MSFVVQQWQALLNDQWIQLLFKTGTDHGLLVCSFKDSRAIRSRFRNQQHYERQPLTPTRLDQRPTCRCCYWTCLQNSNSSLGLRPYWSNWSALEAESARRLQHNVRLPCQQTTEVDRQDVNSQARQRQRDSWMGLLQFRRRLHWRMKRTSRIGYESRSEKIWTLCRQAYVTQQGLWSTTCSSQWPLNKRRREPLESSTAICSCSTQTNGRRLRMTIQRIQHQ